MFLGKTLLIHVIGMPWSKEMLKVRTLSKTRKAKIQISFEERHHMSKSVEHLNQEERRKREKNNERREKEKRKGRRDEK